MLSGAQLGITVTGLLVGYVAQPLVGDSLGILLGGLKIPAELLVFLTTVGVLIAATIIQMIFGELYPKNLAIAAPEPLALGLARSTRIYLTVFGWLIAVFDASANLFLKLLRVEPIHDVDSSVSADDLKRAVTDSRESGDLPRDLAILIERVLDFPAADVEHAMIPNSRVATVADDTTLAELRDLMTRSHSRYPVINHSGEPVGVVELIDLLRTSEAATVTVTQIMRPPIVVPTLMSLPVALEKLSQSRTQLACVIDEYGGFAGILTTEDIAEELVGEISDEHDDSRSLGMIQESSGVWRADGSMPLDEASRLIGFGFPEGDFETLAGLVIASAGGLPSVGDTIRVPLPSQAADFVNGDPAQRSLSVEILSILKFVPAELRITLLEQQGSSDASQEGTP
jgi:CBS domain containing-hemolysin-like protein